MLQSPGNVPGQRYINWPGNRKQNGIPVLTRPQELCAPRSINKKTVYLQYANDGACAARMQMLTRFFVVNKLYMVN